MIDPPQGKSSITPDQPTGEALCLLCRHQLRLIEQHRIGAIKGDDSEALHDLRVAVRRTRSLLGEFRHSFPAGRHEPFCVEFRWLGEVTGPVRDLDVYLEHFPTYRSLLPEATASALDPFHRFLKRHRRQEQRRLIRRLESVRLQRLLSEWQAFLDRYGHDDWPDQASKPIGEVSRHHTWKRYRRFLVLGEAIGARSPDRQLHRLRISGKKLRYLVEFFREIHPPAEIVLLIRAMKDIQDFLGAYQDCTVQQERLAIMARQMSKEGQLPAETDTALQQLVTTLSRQQRQLRKEFPGRFEVFSRGRGRRGFLRLFAPPKEIQ